MEEPQHPAVGTPADPPGFEVETMMLRRLQVLSADAEQALARRMRINPTDLSAMGHIAESQHPLGPSELSSRLGISPGATTEVVDRLEAAGHLRRERDRADRRRVQLRPSPQAIAEVMRNIEPITSGLDRLAGQFTPTERDAIRRYLDGAAVTYRRFVQES